MYGKCPYIQKYFAFTKMFIFNEKSKLAGNVKAWRWAGIWNSSAGTTAWLFDKDKY